MDTSRRADLLRPGATLQGEHPPGGPSRRGPTLVPDEHLDRSRTRPVAWTLSSGLAAVQAPKAASLASELLTRVHQGSHQSDASRGKPTKLWSSFRTEGRSRARASWSLGMQHRLHWMSPAWVWPPGKHRPHADQNPDRSSRPSTAECGLDPSPQPPLAGSLNPGAQRSTTDLHPEHVHRASAALRPMQQELALGEASLDIHNDADV